MIPKKCSLCADVQREPLVWTSLAWYTAAGDRVAYKHRLCATCVATKVVPVQVHSDLPQFTCPACGIGTENEYDAIYGLFYAKGGPPLRFEAPFCPADAARYRVWFQQGATRLEDRPDVRRPGDEAAERETTGVVPLFGVNNRAG